MPDTKLSLPMLKEHLRKYLWIYIAGIAVCLFLSELLWTSTRPQPTNAESVVVYLVGGYGSAEALDAISDDMLARCSQADPRLKQVRFEWLNYPEDDLDYTGAMLLMTRMAVGEGDAFIASATGADALLRYGTLLPLEEITASGWLSEYGLEPWQAELTDEETGETSAFMAGLRLDGADGLARAGAFDNRGAVLGLSVTSENLETTMDALEVMMEDLAKEAVIDAGTEGQ